VHKDEKGVQVHVKQVHVQQGADMHPRDMTIFGIHAMDPTSAAATSCDTLPSSHAAQSCMRRRIHVSLLI
jgi:hypothetical protein